ncbi:MAG: 4Fe-4S dicluster domain-containing protein [Anaerolineales bacterium]|nr:4Fe-4S dicluster domain-containing protein [Anaerolineales bacterium]
MKGQGILKGLGVTLKHLIDTYLEDIKAGKDRYYTEEGVRQRMTSDTKGIFTVNYPEERLPLAEAFRFVPFLVYDEEDGEQIVRCTACGICSKVCPSQCIWITRAEDPETGKPLKTPAEFAIDIDLCMNCGYCAEYCPFDAIKMDHDFELAGYERMEANIHLKDRLLKPASYYAEIRPLNYALEQKAKAELAERKAARRAKVD